MESICVHRSNIRWRISNTERINPCCETCEQGCHSSEVQTSLLFFTDLLLTRNNPCFIWFSSSFFAGYWYLSLHFQPLSAFAFCAQGIWLHQQSPWLFADFDEIKEFLWLFTKFPDFSLTLKNLRFSVTFPCGNPREGQKEWHMKEKRFLFSLPFSMAILRSSLSCLLYTSPSPRDA